MKVKILFNQRERALIEFEAAEQAALAREKLNKITYLNQVLSVSMSKHASINLSSESSTSDS
jgi:RNA recognition motif-containing protein